MLAHAQHQFLVFANKTTLAVVGACGHVSAYGLLGGCAHAFLSMVHAYFFSAICNERWALISFGDICGLACHCICGYTLTIPPSHTLPYYPRNNIPRVLFPSSRPLGGTPTLDHDGRTEARPAIGARQRRICLSSCSPLPASRATKTSYPSSHTHNTLACNHTSLPPPPCPHPCTSQPSLFWL